MKLSDISKFSKQEVELHYNFPRIGIEIYKGRLEVNKKNVYLYLGSFSGNEYCFKRRCHFKVEQERFVQIFPIAE